MMKMGIPGALAGATGAKKSIHATAEDLFLITQDNAKHHNSSAHLEVTPCGKSAAHAVVKWRTKSSVSAFRGPGGENFTPRKMNVETITWPTPIAFKEIRGFKSCVCSWPRTRKRNGVTKLQTLYLRPVHGLREAQTNSLAISILESKK